MIRSTCILPVVAALFLSGCGSFDKDAIGDKMANLIVFQQTTRPAPTEPPRPAADAVVFGDVPGGAFECPSVMVLPEGAAIRAQGGNDAAAVRHQISIQETSRECTDVRPDGSFTLRLGVRGRVVIGTAGGPGTYAATVRIDVRRGQTTVLTRAIGVSATVRPGEGGADFIHVEPGIRIPGGGDVDIEVSLGTGRAAPRTRSARR